MSTTKRLETQTGLKCPVTGEAVGVITLADFRESAEILASSEREELRGQTVYLDPHELVGKIPEPVLFSMKRAIKFTFGEPDPENFEIVAEVNFNPDHPYASTRANPSNAGDEKLHVNIFMVLAAAAAVQAHIAASTAAIWNLAAVAGIALRSAGNLATELESQYYGGECQGGIGQTEARTRAIREIYPGEPCLIRMRMSEIGPFKPVVFRGVERMVRSGKITVDAEQGKERCHNTKINFVGFGSQSAQLPL